MTPDLPRFRKYLQSPETSATVLHAMLRHKYGNEVYGWEPQTVMLEVRDDFGVDLSPEAMERWSAMQVIMTTGAFFDRVDAFLPLCQALATGNSMFAVFTPVNPYVLARGVVEVSLNRELLSFSPFVIAAAKALMLEDGLDFDDSVFLSAMKVEDEKDIDIRELLTHALQNENPNAHTLDLYVLEELNDIMYQLNEIPHLDSVDDALTTDPEQTITDIV